MLTEREMVIAKIGFTKGLVVLTNDNKDWIGKPITPEVATEKLRDFCKKHFFTFEQGLDLEQEIDQMLGDSTLT